MNSRQTECSIVPSFKFNLSYIFDDQEKTVRENLFGHQFPVVNNSPQISESEVCASAISRAFSVQTVPLLLSFLTWLLRQGRLLMASSHLSCFSYVMSSQLVLAIKDVQATEEWLVSKFKEYGNACIFHLHKCQCWCQPECYPCEHGRSRRPTVTSASAGLCRQRAMDCDLTSLAAYPRAPAEPGPAWLVPGLLPSVPARCGGWSEASPGAGWCFGGCRRQLSVPVPEPSPVFPRPCLARAAGHRGARLQQRR